MEDRNLTVSGQPGATHRRRWPRILKWTSLSLLALIFLLAAAGFIYNAIEEHADARRFPQMGKSVSLGGEFGNLSLNLSCSGTGSPTVVLDSGLGVPGVHGWKQVQPDVARFTRVCSYDRAGYAWSSAGPMPRTSREIARELHALLAAAGEKPPYILVGHSFGGYNVRVFNGEYSRDVAGLVLVDPSQEDIESKMSLALLAELKEYDAIAKRQAKLAPALVYLGIARLQDDTAGLTFLSPEDRREALYLEVQTKFYKAEWSETESMPTSTQQVRASGNLGDKPLIVLTAGKVEEAPPGFPQKDLDDFQNAVINDLHVRLAHLSTRGRQVIVRDSDHMIPFERPDAVVSSIHEVWAEISKPSVR